MENKKAVRLRKKEKDKENAENLLQNETEEKEEEVTSSKRTCLSQIWKQVMSMKRKVYLQQTRHGMITDQIMLHRQNNQENIYISSYLNSK
ncbi:MAG: hypothetical protein IPG18_00175 [Saprospiraceae bacterium]|nr:hypothetical protein [Saprospiraceae bacterium]